MSLEPLHPPSPNGQAHPAASPSAPLLSFSLPRFLNRLRRFWYLPLMGGALGVAVVWAWLRYTPDQYLVTTVIRVQPPERENISPEMSLLREINSGPNTTNLDTELRILRSREILREVVRDLQLDIGYRLDGRMFDTEVYHQPFVPLRFSAHQPLPGAYERDFYLQPRDDTSFFWRWGEENEAVFPIGRPFQCQWGTFLLAYDTSAADLDREFIVRFSAPEKMAASIRSRLSTSLIRSTELVELGLEDRIPQRAADILRRIIAVYDRESTEYQNRRNNATLRFVDDRLRLLSGELDSVGRRVEKFVLANDLVAGPEGELNRQFLRLEENRSEREALDDELELIALVNDYLQRPLPVIDTLALVPFRSNIQGLDLSASMSRYNQLLVERNNMARSVTPDNPYLREMERRMNNLRESMSEVLDQTRNKVETQLLELRTEADSIQQAIRSLPARERGLLSIERQKQIKEQLYLYLLQRREESAITRVVTGTNVRVIEPPVGGSPVGPAPLVSYLFGLLGGIVLPLGILALLVATDRKLHHAHQIKKEAGLPLLGVVGQAKKGESVVVGAHTRTVLSEQFRLLRTHLHFQAIDGQDQVILVSSAINGEGKSFVSLNLAYTLAIAGKRVCLLEFDLRRPRLCEYLDLEKRPDRPGLSHFLIGDRSLDDILYPVPGEVQLDFVASGPLPPNPAELLLSSHMSDLFDGLRARYDHILVDSPPVAFVTDALLLGQQADLSLLILRHRYSTQEQLQLVQEIIRDQRLPHPAIVFNGQRRTTGYGYGYGSYGGKKSYYRAEG